MLRMRKKSSAEMPNINSGKPWSEMDLADLANCLEFGEPVEQIADFLCRDVEEVEAKVAELRHNGAYASPPSDRFHRAGPCRAANEGSVRQRLRARTQVRVQAHLQDGRAPLRNPPS